MICPRVAPMAREASTAPEPSWVMFCSTRRAKYGIALIVSGTITAAVPTEVPTTNRVNGMMAMSRIRKGKDRIMLTSPETIAWERGRGASPSGAWTKSQIPSGVPSRTATGMATAIIAKVSSMAWLISGSRSMTRFISAHPLPNRRARCAGTGACHPAARRPGPAEQTWTRGASPRCGPAGSRR